MSEIFNKVGKIFEETFTIPTALMLSKNLAHVFTVIHTLAGFKELTKESDEEFRSASFMGVWSSTIGFYNFISALSEEKPCQKILINALSKKEEKSVGADFGIAIQVSKEAAEGPEYFYRLAYFQAKNNKSKTEGKQTFHINQIKSDATSKELRMAAQQLGKWIRPVEYPQKFSFDSPSNAEYQIYTFARYDRGYDWTHYIVWQGEEILTVSTRAIWNHLHTNKIHLSGDGRLNAATYSIKIITKSTTSLPDIDKPVDFQDLLLCAVNETECPVGWREVRVEEAASIIEEFIELGVTWYVQSDSSGDGGMKTQLERKEIVLKIVEQDLKIGDFIKGIPIPPTEASKTLKP